jgi:ubiquinone/menaquinone biosynthesis C-methylase UbiE
MNDKYRQQWETLGEEDPYWAVLSEPDKKGDRWEKAEFFQTGADEIGSLLVKMAQLGLRPEFGFALDYGCGVGRLSRALATPFQRVMGVDISETMLSEARSINSGYDNLRFSRNDGETLKNIEDESVDFVYSNLVLQHSPRRIQRSLISEFCRILRPGGILVFQTASHQNKKTIGGLLHFLSGNLPAKLAARARYGKNSIMEMHTIDIIEVTEILHQREIKVVEIEKCDAAGDAFVSHMYYATKLFQ